MNNYPKWTILYNTNTEEDKWIGTGREFFDDREAAERRCKLIPETRTPGYLGPVCATLRPFHNIDIPHLGAVHAKH